MHHFGRARRRCYQLATTRRVQPVDGGLVLEGEPPAVEIAGHRDAGMPELALDVDRTHPVHQQQARVGVPEAMRGEVGREPGGPEHALEDPVDRPGDERPAVRRDEHPRRHLGPAAPERLGRPVQVQAPERPGELLAHVHGAPMAALGGSEPPAGQRPGNPDLAAPARSTFGHSSASPSPMRMPVRASVRNSGR
jgi:hypothetical protein